jgi:hypothetical protein
MSSSWGYGQGRSPTFWRVTSDGDCLCKRGGAVIAKIVPVPDREDLWRIQEPPGFIGEFERFEARINAQNLARRRTRAA